VASKVRRVSSRWSRPQPQSPTERALKASTGCRRAALARRDRLLPLEPTSIRTRVTSC
jgi:hypothetical protein